jgi:hypothetical protein
MSKINLLFISLFCAIQIFAQDSLPYKRYNDKIVLSIDFGIPGAPFVLDVPTATKSSNRLKYITNVKTVVGFGVNYKWFSARLGVSSRDYLYSVSGYGTSKYYDFGFDFTHKNMFFDVDFHNYQGYGIQNASKFADTGLSVKGSILKPGTSTASFSSNMWYFFNRHIKMSAMKGKTARYTENCGSFFIKGTFNVHGVADNGGIIPVELRIPEQSRTYSALFYSWDFGAIPGYAYVYHKNGFQAAAIGGAGFVLQAKAYQYDANQHAFAGLAPRLDFKLMMSYNKERWFTSFAADFDRKSIKFGYLGYKQTFYYIKFAYGYRFNKKQKVKKEKKRN